jgi:MSHA biogenesis protein MshN
MAGSRGAKGCCVNEVSARRWCALVLLVFSGIALALGASVKSATMPGESSAVRSAVSAASTASAHSAEQAQTSARQAAENAYRRALFMLQEGRISAALTTLEQALRSDPGHDAARQTLIGLLFEAKRTDEAIQQLQQALHLDQNQPALAMALARLQVEQGGPALQTLMQSLPFALEKADYQAFVAALL